MFNRVVFLLKTTELKIMAAKRVELSPDAQLFGERRMLEYAQKHGFTPYLGTYRIVKKRAAHCPKVIGPYGRTRKSSEKEEYCEIMKVVALRKGRQPVEGYLVGYSSKGIRFDANAKY